MGIWIFEARYLGAGPIFQNVHWLWYCDCWRVLGFQQCISGISSLDGHWTICPARIVQPRCNSNSRRFDHHGFDQYMPINADGLEPVTF